MKKLIMALAIAASAVIANAGTVTWQCTGNLVPGSTTDKLSGAIAYLFVGDSIAGVADSILDGTFSTASAIADKTTSSTGAISKAAIGSYTSEDVSLYMVIFDAESIAAAHHFKVSDVITQTFGTSGNKTYNFSTNIAAKEWTEMVPEPTSGLLMLLGMAGLALRRRRA